jgi:hypothetical protein
LASKWYKIALEIQAKTGGFGVEVGGDPAGGGRSQMADSRTAARRPYQLILEELRKAGLRVKQTNARGAPGVDDSVSDVNSQFKSGVNPNYLYGATIDVGKCKQFVFDLRNMGYKPNGDLNKKAGEVGDASDAARYLISQERRPKSGVTITVAKQ